MPIQSDFKFEISTKIGKIASGPKSLSKTFFKKVSYIVISKCSQEQSIDLILIRELFGSLYYMNPFSHLVYSQELNGFNRNQA